MTRGHDIRDLLEQATADEPPPTAGPAAVFSRARSIQRRRRLGAGLAGGATLAVALTAGVLLTGPAGDPAPVAPPAATGGPSSSTPPRAVPMTKTTVLDALRTLLPADYARSGEVARKGFAAVILTDPAGRTRVEVNVQPDFATGAGKISAAHLVDRYDCAKRSDPAGTRCTATVLTDGTRVVSIDGPAGEPGAADVTRRQVDTLAPGGRRVVVTAWNATDASGGPATRSEPVLTGDDLRRLATSGRWSTMAAATPNAPRSSDGGAPNK